MKKKPLQLSEYPREVFEGYWEKVPLGPCAEDENCIARVWVRGKGEEVMKKDPRPGHPDYASRNDLLLAEERFTSFAEADAWIRGHMDKTKKGG